MNNASEEVEIGKTALAYKMLQDGVHILVVGEVSVGKTSLISSCIGQSVVSQENTLAHTLKFNTNTSSITEIRGLYTSNKKRGQVWKAVVDFIEDNNTNVVWFCVGSDFIDSNDELWHWMKCLEQLCNVILVRTKCISPAQGLSEDVAQRFPNSPPPVVSLLAKDMQLNPKGGGAVLDAYGVDDLVKTTEEALKNKTHVKKDAIAKLQKQVARDEERYASEEAQKGVILNSLRSLSGTENEPSKKDSLGDEDFEIVPRPESPGSGFVHLVKSKQARTAVGAIVAFAVIIQLAYMYKP
eukprot:Phypoly_transcript_10991.p1 GENE.Phypoly_transcript_10991~~Phypoly_transcript_10991.p1  ORF type:complete len:297 (+),score=44.89 Phypoly_transcript_10991:94-984(+)